MHYQLGMSTANIIRPKPKGGDLFFGRLRARYPDLCEDESRQIASIWSEELDSIITRMIKINDEMVGPALHIEMRIEAIFEMAKLRAWLSERMLSMKLDEGIAATPLTAASERAAMNSPLGKERIENTAQNVAKVWTNFVLKWRAKWPLVIPPDNENDRSKLTTSKPKQTAKAPGVRRNHYSPV